MAKLRTRRSAATAAYGPLATLKEWAYCLVSPKHAETTWLRIAEDTERRAFRHIERFLFSVLGALIAMIFVLIHQYNFFHKNMDIVEYNDVIIYTKHK